MFSKRKEYKQTFPHTSLMTSDRCLPIHSSVKHATQPRHQIKTSQLLQAMRLMITTCSVSPQSLFRGTLPRETQSNDTVLSLKGIHHTTASSFKESVAIMPYLYYDLEAKSPLALFLARYTSLRIFGWIHNLLYQARCHAILRLYLV